MARVLRGDVVWANLEPTVGREQAGQRPVVVLTSQEPRAGFPLTHELTSVKMTKRAWVKIAQVRTLSTRRLGKTIGRLAPEELDRLVEGLNEIIAT